MSCIGLPHAGSVLAARPLFAETLPLVAPPQPANCGPSGDPGAAAGHRLTAAEARSARGLSKLRRHASRLDRVTSGRDNSLRMRRLIGVDDARVCALMSYFLVAVTVAAAA